MSKRYERMSREEIIIELSKLDSSPACNALLNWLTKEVKIKKVHRYELIKSPEDLDKLSEEWKDYCDPRHCANCKYLIEHANGGSSMCFAEYLKEEIEVEE